MPSKSGPETQAGAALQKLDPLLHHRARLGICVLLSSADALAFSRLKSLLGETDGNLGAQLRKLEDNGYIAVRKEFANRRPVSWYSLTPSGRNAVTAHLAAYGELIDTANGTAG